jgi:hypothetical protein
MALLLLLVLVVADLLRPGSYILGEWHQLTRPEGTPVQRLLRRFGIG